MNISDSATKELADLIWDRTSSRPTVLLREQLAKVGASIEHKRTAKAKKTLSFVVQVLLSSFKRARSACSCGATTRCEVGSAPEQFKGVIGALPLDDSEVDPQQGEVFEDARVPERTHSDGIESYVLD